MKKFLLTTILSSFFIFGSAHAEELKPTIWKVDEKHLQAIQDWNISAFKEISQQTSWSEAEFVSKLKSFNNLLIKETNIMPLSVCVFDNALVVKSIESLNCD